MIRQRKGIKCLLQEDQVSFFMAVVSKIEGITFNEVKTLHQALSDYSSGEYHSKVISAIFKLDFEKKESVFYDFVRSILFREQYPWDEKDFERVCEFLGDQGEQFRDKAKSQKTPYQLSSDRIGEFLNRKFALYVPLTFPENNRTGIAKAKIEFKSLVDVKLSIPADTTGKVRHSIGRYKFIDDASYLLIEFDIDDLGDSSFQFLFDVRDKKDITELRGHFLNLEVSSKTSNCIIEEVKGKGFKPKCFLDKEIKEISDDIFNYCHAITPEDTPTMTILGRMSKRKYDKIVTDCALRGKDRVIKKQQRKLLVSNLILNAGCGFLLYFYFHLFRMAINTPSLISVQNWGLLLGLTCLTLWRVNELQLPIEFGNGGYYRRKK